MKVIKYDRRCPFRESSHSPETELYLLIRYMGKLINNEKKDPTIRGDNTLKRWGFTPKNRIELGVNYK